LDSLSLRTKTFIMKLQLTKLFMLSIALSLFSLASNAQRYKTLADTPRLNARYNRLTQELTELNKKLESERSKTADYQAKTAEAAKNAERATQDSREQADKATNASTKDARRAVKEAKRARREVGDAKDAEQAERNNLKRIQSLTEDIEKKQKQLDDLSKQRETLMMTDTSTHQ
jgi:chromosome segregation ATPase